MFKIMLTMLMLFFAICGVNAQNVDGVYAGKASLTLNGESKERAFEIYIRALDNPIGLNNAKSEYLSLKRVVYKIVIYEGKKVKNIASETNFTGIVRQRGSDVMIFETVRINNDRTFSFPERYRSSPNYSLKLYINEKKFTCQQLPGLHHVSGEYHRYDTDSKKHREKWNTFYQKSRDLIYQLFIGSFIVSKGGKRMVYIGSTEEGERGQEIFMQIYMEDLVGAIELNPINKLRFLVHTPKEKGINPVYLVRPINSIATKYFYGKFEKKNNSRNPKPNPNISPLGDLLHLFPTINIIEVYYIEDFNNANPYASKNLLSEIRIDRSSHIIRKHSSLITWR